MEKKIYIAPLVEETPLGTWCEIMKTSIPPGAGPAPARGEFIP